jgi:hypothetical protein
MTVLLSRMLCFCILALCFVPLIASAQPSPDAPLGLTWGVSTGELRQIGVELNDAPGTEYGRSFLASKLSKVVADQSAAILYFGFDDKLWRVVINSRPFPNDPTGFAVRSRFSELSNVLSEKYGRPSETHRLGEYYSKPENFLFGISNGQSKWFSNFDISQMWVQLAITAEDVSTGGWRLIYEYKPLKFNFNTSKRSREKGTL